MRLRLSSRSRLVLILWSVCIALDFEGLRHSVTAQTNSPVENSVFSVISPQGFNLTPTPSPPVAAPEPATTDPQAASETVSTSPPAFLEVLYQNNFDEGRLDGLTVSRGWNIVYDGDDGRLCVSNFNARFGSYPNILFGAVDWENYSVEVTVQLTAREAGHMAILSHLNADLWGYRHSLSFDEWGSRVSQYYYGGENGRSTRLLREGQVTIRSGLWYNLRAEADGVTLRTIVNGELIANYGLTLAPQGSAGLEAGPGARVCLDDLVVRSLNRSRAALSAARRGVLRQGANVRLWPGAWSDRIAAAAASEEVYLLGSSADQQWTYVRKMNSSIQGWIWAKYVHAPN